MRQTETIKLIWNSINENLLITEKLAFLYIKIQQHSEDKYYIPNKNNSNDIRGMISNKLNRNKIKWSNIVLVNIIKSWDYNRTDTNTE